MTDPENPRRTDDGEWLPRCCQAWIAEQTRPRPRRGPTGLPSPGVPPEARYFHGDRGNRIAAETRPEGGAAGD
jgi:hypothetical protein